jgi:flagella basal body P-ring formation protein FlgA
MSARGQLLMSALLWLAQPGPAVIAADQAPATRAASAHIVDVARDYLRRELQAARPDVERLELAAVGKPAVGASLTPKRWDDAHVQVALEGAAGGLLRTRACVRVRLKPTDGAWHTIPVWFSVRALRTVLLAQRRLGAHDAPSAVDFVPQVVDVAPLPGIPARPDVELKNLRMRRDIWSGHVLLERDLESVPEIERGQQVEVTVRVGTVAIQTSAFALSEARTGDLVSLRNPTSNERYLAHVVGRGEAVLQ